jgi:hypothetical protein
MKKRALALALLASISSLSAQVPTASKIDGAFGRKLGDSVEVTGQTMIRGLEGLQYVVRFVPAEGYPGLSNFAICVTPYSHVIFKVEASGTLATVGDVENLRRTLELKYGPFLRLENIGNTARWKFADGERSIWLRVTDRNVTVSYVDDSLAARARLESTTGTTAADGKTL